MLAIVTNFGRPRVFPSCQGDLWLNRLQPIEIRDPELIKQLQDYNKRRDILLEIKIVDEAAPPAYKVEVKETKTDYSDEAELRMDYSQFKILQLRSMAKAKGIEGTFKMTKNLLIEKLEEKDGIS